MNIALLNNFCHINHHHQQEREGKLMSENTNNNVSGRGQKGLAGVSKTSGSIISPLAAILFIRFFVPWISVSCSGSTVVDGASGLDLVAGVNTGIPWEGPMEFPSLLLIVFGALIAFVAGLALFADQFLFKSRYASVVLSVIAAGGFALATLVWVGFLFQLVGMLVRAEQEGIPLDVTEHFGSTGVFISALGGMLASALTGVSSFLKARRSQSPEQKPAPAGVRYDEVAPAASQT